MAGTTDQIVIVNTLVTQAPAASTLQQSGALISFGGTTLATNTASYCPANTNVMALLSTVGNHVEVSNEGTSFFAQGGVIGVNVLELGLATAASAQISAVTTYLASNPNEFYAYCVPADWDASDSAGFNTLAEVYASPSSKVYFFANGAQENLSTYAGTKSVAIVVPAPTANGTEFDAAALMYQFLVNNPAVASPAAPMAYRFLYGVTPWVLAGNGTAINAILAAYGNIIQTGAEGGISTSCLYKGTFMDGNQMMFWYAIDWVQIQAKQILANAIINAANSGTPIYYNQNGINTLQTIAQGICNSAVSFGLLLSGNVSATAFATYVAANPSAYAAGTYDGLTATVTPQLGFLQITFNLDATSFAT